MTEVKYGFIRKHGPNHKKGVERESSSQAGEEIISWNNAIEFVVNIEGEAEIQEMVRKQSCHYYNSCHVHNLKCCWIYTVYGNYNTLNV